MIFARKVIDPKISTIVPIVDSPRRTWRQTAIQGLLTALSMAASRMRTPSAASPVSTDSMVAVFRQEHTAGLAAGYMAAAATDNRKKSMNGDENDALDKSCSQPSALVPRWPD